MKSNDEKVTAGALGLAAQCWCDPDTSHITMDEKLATAFAKRIDRYVDALIWCSGSADFGPGGKAQKGWDKLCRPLIKEWTDLVDLSAEE